MRAASAKALSKSGSASPITTRVGAFTSPSRACGWVVDSAVGFMATDILVTPP